MPHQGLNRYVPRLTLESLAKFGATIPGAIPDLPAPQLPTFASDCGMDSDRVRGYRRLWALPRVADTVDHRVTRPRQGSSTYPRVCRT